MRLTGRLDPMHLRSPRIRSLLRYAAVAGLLALAAGTLLIDPAPPTDCRGGGGSAAAPPRGTPAPEHSPATDPPASPATAAPDRTPVPPAALTLPRNAIGVPVQLAEPGTAAVLRPGDRVDVIARTGSPDAPADREAVVLAQDVLVISSSDEGIVFLAMPSRQASRVSRMAPDVAVGVTVHPA